MSRSNFLNLGSMLLMGIFLMETCWKIANGAPHPKQNVMAQAELEPQPIELDGSGSIKAKGTDGFIGGFISSFSMIVVSELGDKTFFIAAIMAMRHARLTVFAGAITALGLMTVLSGIEIKLKEVYYLK